MPRSFTEKKRIRKSFGRIEEIINLPNLIHLQRCSYEDFLQMNVPHEQRTKTGLVDVFNSIFPIKDNAGRCHLEFCRYEFDRPKYDEVECRQKGLTYAAPLRVAFRLVVWELDPDTKARSIRDIKEQDVFVGDIPIMTDRGTFVVNGIERVIVSQVHRSPGVLFDKDTEKMSSDGKPLYVARIVPYRGSWVDIEFDHKDLMLVRIDRRRKLPIGVFLMALDSKETEELRAQSQEPLKPTQITGMSREEILTYFYDTITYTLTEKGWETPFIPDRFKSVTLTKDLVNAETQEIVATAGSKMLPRLLKKYKQEGLSKILIQTEDFVGQFMAHDIVNEQTGQIFTQSGEEITTETLARLSQLQVEEISILYIDYINVSPHLLKSLQIEKVQNREEAFFEIYKAVRPGEPPTLEGAEAIFNSLFFDPDRYDLSSVGRAKLNERLNMTVPDDVRVLRKEDFLIIMKTLLDLKDGRGDVDDIDNLGNRRVRSVGELLENQFRLGIVRMERAIRERFSGIDLETVMPHDLVNAKPIAAAVREFFGTSQLSQFMDQTNPLSEITHKRRISALGPGGLSRDRAGFEVRDVHPTHYGRVCPIETPEGPNIGLINSLATYARVNKYGFIEAPYRLMKEGRITSEVIYLTAIQEEKYTIAQASINLSPEGYILDEEVPARRAGEFGIFPKEEITLIDLSPKQMVSVAASLIPFLENDDASRALMGSNMQRQAVPLIKTDAPLIGTGMEKTVAIDSGAVVVSKRFGVVDQVDGQRIVIKALDSANNDLCVGVDIYNLIKFQGSNMSTCLNQKPLVKRGDYVKGGDVIADGPSTDLGELALGRNVLVAFMSWQGYNFEDSIVISETVARQDLFTSIHIESFEVMARDTKLGNEEITRDIPNTSEESLRHLDEAGIVYIGAEVGPSDVLVGKVTPKGDTLISPEEKLLRAIFGEKAADVKDSSLRVPPGTFGTVMDVRVFLRRGIDKDERTITIERQEIERFAKDRDAQRNILERTFLDRLKERLLGQKILRAPKGIVVGVAITEKMLEEISPSQLRQVVVESEEVMIVVEQMKAEVDQMLARLQARFEDKVAKIQTGDELIPGVLKIVKVYIAVKRKLQPGDKMAGRHGNKGVVSKVLPIEDMPYLEDGTPVDIVLNPLGVPSRMNVGQILETHLGAASVGLGKKINKMLEAYYEDPNRIDELRSQVLDFYERESDKDSIIALSDIEFLELARNLRKGVPMATPVFDGAHMNDVNKQLEKADIDTSGQVTVYDGRTGDAFDRKITVGYIYMLKLHHLVDDKIHARSIGPYSLVTQQPLGGKAQFGGQRFGEMEVWALEAYGAAYTLQEMLTVKSDDVIGRMKVYEAIVRGDEQMQAGIPESFNVLVKELRSLALNISFEYSVTAAAA